MNRREAYGADPKSRLFDIFMHVQAHAREDGGGTDQLIRDHRPDQFASGFHARASPRLVPC